MDNYFYRKRYILTLKDTIILGKTRIAIEVGRAVEAGYVFHFDIGILSGDCGFGDSRG